jgi:hypothetical protein
LHGFGDGGDFGADTIIGLLKKAPFLVHLGRSHQGVLVRRRRSL